MLVNLYVYFYFLFSVSFLRRFSVIIYLFYLIAFCGIVRYYLIDYVVCRFYCAF